MAEPKKKKIVQAQPLSEEAKQKYQQARPVGNAAGYRAGAILLWIAAIVCEVLAILTFAGKIFASSDPESNKKLILVIVFLVADLICVIIASSLWKHANRIRPASEKNKLKFWLWNNLGVIVSAFAFIPFIIIALTDKNADKKTKAIAAAVAAVALIIGGLTSYDFNPTSQESLSAAEEAISGTVYWAPSGKVYHTHTDCQSLNQSETLTEGTVAQAFEANRNRLCAFCARRDNIAGVVTDEVKAGEEDETPDKTDENAEQNEQNEQNEENGETKEAA